MRLSPRKPVTPETSNIFRRRALRKSRAHIDEETGDVIMTENPTRIQKWTWQLRQVFTREFWTDKFENTGAEILVDGPLLSWAYLEIGMIEAIGALVSFFVIMYRRGITPHDAWIMQKGNGSPTYYWTDQAQSYKGIDAATQVNILAEAQSEYYWAVMTMQMFNLFACKTRLTLPFGRYMFANHVSFFFLSAVQLSIDS